MYYSMPEKLTSDDVEPWPSTTPLVIISSGGESSNGSGSSSSDEESFDLNGEKVKTTQQPHPDDVLLGRGKKHHAHPGNARFASTSYMCLRCGCCFVIVVSCVLNSFFVLVASVATHHHTELVNQYRDEYFATIKPLEKKALLHEIVSRILERGRFLKSSNNASGGGGGWDEVDQERAILKTAHAIQRCKNSVEHNAVVHGHIIQRPETPVRSSQSGRRTAPTTTRPEGPFVSVPHTVTRVSVPHTVTPTTRTTPNAVSSWGNDLLLLWCTVKVPTLYQRPHGNCSGRP
jgi:hypothetical protein